MTRPVRIDYPGAWHHVMHRGARRERIFRDDLDAALFYDAVQEAVERFSIEVHAWSLMPNHYHLLVHSPHASLSRAMRHLNGVFTQRLNQRERWDGPVFRGRFASQLVERDAYLEVLVAYLHLNPVRAHMVKRPDDECWTSHRAYLGLERAPSWLSRDEMLTRFGGAEALHRYVLDIHDGSRSLPDGMVSETGWLPADDATLERPATTEARARVLNADEAFRRVEAVTKATRDEILASRKGPGGNPAKRFAAWALTNSTLFSHTQVGRLLGMSAPHVAVAVRRVGHQPKGVVATWMEEWKRRALEEEGSDVSSAQS